MKLVDKSINTENSQITNCFQVLILFPAFSIKAIRVSPMELLQEEVYVHREA